MKIRNQVLVVILNGSKTITKKILIALALCLTAATDNAIAQIEISGLAGWVPASKTTYSFNGYRLKIDDTPSYGVGLGFATPVGIVAELSFTLFSSTLTQDGGG